MNGILLTLDDARRLQQLERDVRDLKGSIGKADPRQMNVLPTVIRWGKIIAATATGVNDAQTNPVQWTYTVAEVAKVKTGYQTSAWAAITGGFAGTAYHLGEYGNTGTGRQMNGTNHDGTLYADTTFKMQPLQVNAVVPFVFITAVQSNVPTIEAWIISGIGNAEDGECS